jgi:hypothetical protein
MRIVDRKLGFEKKSVRFTAATGGAFEDNEKMMRAAYPIKITEIDGRLNFSLFFDMARISGKRTSIVSLDIADIPNERPLSRSFSFSR